MKIVDIIDPSSIVRLMSVNLWTDSEIYDTIIIMMHSGVQEAGRFYGASISKEWHVGANATFTIIRVSFYDSRSDRPFVVNETTLWMMTI